MRSLRLSLRAPNKLAMLQKELMASAASRFYPVYTVNEFPKSGGTWVKHMLAECLGVPVWTKGKPVWQPCVLQGHWIKPRGKCRVVALLRDGRDVMVSLYFHSFFLNEFQNEPLVKASRERFRFADYKDVRGNLLAFMRGIDREPLSPHFRWADFTETWVDREGVMIARYEDLRANTAGELERIVTSLSGRRADPALFAAVAARYTMDEMRSRTAELNPGIIGRQRAEVSFIRKGSVGGWSDSFTDEALDWFENRHSKLLTRLGYQIGRP